MPFTPESFHKTQGDPLRSQDWNNVVNEIGRLETDKVNRAGDAMTGPLTIDGNVGIGTTSPIGTLHVSKTSGTPSLMIAPSADSAGSMIAMKSTYGSTPGTDDSHWILLAGSGNPSEFKNFRIYDQTANAGGGLDRLVINKDGNVGIGTTVPQSKLAVSGGVAIGSSYAGANAAPDNGLLVEGNVGIGTTNPDGTLTIKAHSNGWVGGLTLLSNNETAKWRIHPENASGAYHGQGLMVSNDDNNVRFVIN